MVVVRERESRGRGRAGGGGDSQGEGRWIRAGFEAKLCEPEDFN